MDNINQVMVGVGGCQPGNGRGTYYTYQNVGSRRVGVVGYVINLRGNLFD